MNFRFKQHFYSLLLACFLCFQNAIPYTKSTHMVAMRDSIRLATDVYQPSSDSGSWPTILVRTPYGRELYLDDWMFALFNFIIDQYKYVVVIQDTRGRFDSEGLDSLYFSDGWGRVRDGYDTVEWIAQQSWSDGKIGTFGASAMGITQYLLAGAGPPHLSCCLVLVGASNLYEDALFYGGVYRKSLVDGWLIENESEHLIDFFVRHPNYEPLYDIVNLSTRYDSVNVPILHIGGWHDIFIQGQINAFCGIQKYGGPMAAANQKLIIGPWIHNIISSIYGELTFPGSSILNFLGIIIDWFEYWLKGEENGISDVPAVQYYLMGDADQPDGPGNRWIKRKDWPPCASLTPFYFRTGGILSQAPPAISEMYDEFDYDPENPVPTLGGRNLNILAGSYDQLSVESRPDVLVYTTEPLKDSMTVVGKITVTLWASTDGLDTDFTAKLCDVYPDGRSMLVADGIIQARHRNSLTSEELLMPGAIYRYTIDLWSTAIVFAQGHRVRVSVSSSNARRFEANPNTGEPFRQNTTTRIVHQTVYHNPSHPSALYLPVVEGAAPPVLVDGTDYFGKSILEQNYPNPFNEKTFIPLRFPVGEINGQYFGRETRIEVFDLGGRSVRRWKLYPQPGDLITVPWQGDSREGHLLSSGIYICRLTVGNIKETKKMTLLR